MIHQQPLPTRTKISITNAKNKDKKAFAINNNHENNPLMVYPDRTSNIPTNNDRFSDQNMDEVEETRYN